MTTTANTNPANEPTTVNSNAANVPEHSPNEPIIVKRPDTKEPEIKENRVDRVADKLAHNAANTEQKFDKDNSNLFSK
jgi:hypothetical protein